MSAFMVNTNVMAKVVTAILLNLDTFDGESTCRVKMLAAPTDEQKDAGTKIGRKLFLMNRRALRARYGCGDDLHVPEFVVERWADATPVQQFKAMSCLLYQCHEGNVHESRLYAELNHAAGELAQRIVQDLPEYDKASWGD
jgi:GH24 family phage-related lysozyme (muramidase)